jgi:hypothetical protein|tara:strand:+ start:1621 stop:2343 length:723 start_codon:yes stop_codon:yes gene_type:complete
LNNKIRDNAAVFFAKMGFDNLLLYTRFKDISGQNGYYRAAHGIVKINKASIINHLIARNHYKTYLEIGVRKGYNFQEVNILEKTSVDPNPKCECNYVMTSDAFFQQLSEKNKYDVIFIDGLHLEEQVDRDISNSLYHLNKGGTIVVHDCNPPTKLHQIKDRGEMVIWNGTVWKSWVKLRRSRTDLEMRVVDVDWGVGIIRRGKQVPYSCSDLEANSFDYFEKNRLELLNLINVDEFFREF